MVPPRGPRRRAVPRSSPLSRGHGRLAGALLPVLASALAIFSPLPAARADDTSPVPAQVAFPEWPTLARTATRGAWVVATNSLLKLRLLRWADDRMDRIERLTGIARNSDGRTLRIVQRPPAPGAPAASVSQRLEYGLVAQTLMVRGTDDFDRQAADAGLCQLLVYGYVLDHWTKAATGRDYAEWVACGVPERVPTWLWRGLAGCLDSSSRADSSDQLLAAWREGQLCPLVGFLRAGGRLVAASDADVAMESPLQRAYETMLVSWLLNQPAPDTRLDMLCARLAAGERITPEALVENIQGSGSVVDLEERWDAWILAQGRMIYAPGETRALDVVRLRAELILDRNLLGIPEASGFPARGTMRDLLPARDAPWIPTVVSIKSLRLHTLALGKDEAFQDICEAYCAYLAALAERKKERRLERLWTAAEESWRTYQAAPGGQPASATPVGAE